MNKINNIKINNIKIKKKILNIVLKKIKLLLSVLAILLIVTILIFQRNAKSASSKTTPVKTITVTVDKSFEFPALNNQGKATKEKIKFTIANAEKTNQVTVKDQVFTAKNNKLFLIINLEYKNDTTTSLNIFPGDLIRLTYDGKDENKFAPDLHNNLVPISAISTKLDRIGFVVPDSIKDFKLFIGELEGKKETVEINFPS